MVAEAIKNGLPPKEVLIPKQEFTYTLKIKQRMLVRDVQASMTFSFEGMPAFGFIGSTEYSHSEGHEDKVCEAVSFTEAAKDIWSRFRRSDKRSDFVKLSLVSKWNELNGEQLTNQLMFLEKDSDDIFRQKKINRSKR